MEKLKEAVSDFTTRLEETVLALREAEEHNETKHYAPIIQGILDESFPPLACRYWVVTKYLKGKR